MKFTNLANMAKKAVDKRGGTDALKADLNELQKIAKGKGSASDKAKQAAAALKTPGAGKPHRPEPTDRTPPAT
jgi:hypothetical protein